MNYYKFEALLSKIEEFVLGSHGHSCPEETAMHNEYCDGDIQSEDISSMEVAEFEYTPLQSNFPCVEVSEDISFVEIEDPALKDAPAHFEGVLFISELKQNIGYVRLFPQDQALVEDISAFCCFLLTLMSTADVRDELEKFSSAEQALRPIEGLECPRLVLSIGKYSEPSVFTAQMNEDLNCFARRLSDIKNRMISVLNDTNRSR